MAAFFVRIRFFASSNVFEETNFPEAKKMRMINISLGSSAMLNLNLMFLVISGKLNAIMRIL